MLLLRARPLFDLVTNIISRTNLFSQTKRASVVKRYYDITTYDIRLHTTRPALEWKFQSSPFSRSRVPSREQLPGKKELTKLKNKSGNISTNFQPKYLNRGNWSNFNIKQKANKEDIKPNRCIQTDGALGGTFAPRQMTLLTTLSAIKRMLKWIWHKVCTLSACKCIVAEYCIPEYHLAWISLSILCEVMVT